MLVACLACPTALARITSDFGTIFTADRHVDASDVFRDGGRVYLACVTCPIPTDPDPKLGSGPSGGDRPAADGIRLGRAIHEHREAEIALAQGSTTGEVVHQLGVTEQTSEGWRKEYGGMKVDPVRRPKELEREDSRRKRLLAGAHLDNAIPNEASQRNS